MDKTQDYGRLLPGRAAAIQQQLDHPKEGRLGQQIFYFASVDSTNTVAKAMAQAGADCTHGTVVLAGEQTGGRGRFDRVFVSPKSTGMYLSVILRPAEAGFGPSALSPLTAFVGVAVCEGIEDVCGIWPKLKWPNDVLLNGYKIGGILTEMATVLSSSGEAVAAYTIVGIGLNVNQQEQDFPPQLRGVAASLQMATGSVWDVDTVTAAIIARLDAMYPVALLDGIQSYLERYSTLCTTIGQEIRFVQNGMERFGTAVGVDGDAGLMVETTSGERLVLCSGEISLHKE